MSQTSPLYTNIIFDLEYYMNRIHGFPDRANQNKRSYLEIAMNTISLFSRTKSSRNSRKAFKRTLQLEALEERQLLTASPLTDELTLASSALFASSVETNNDFVAVLDADPDVIKISHKLETPTAVVNSTANTVVPTDNAITLPEAISYAGNTYRKYRSVYQPVGDPITVGTTITFDNTLGSTVNISLNDTIQLEKSITINAGSKDVTITVNANDIFSDNSKATLTTEMGGRIRLVNGSGTTVYDTAWETPSNVVTTNEDKVDNTDGLISLREAVSYIGTSFYDFATHANTPEVTNEITFDFGDNPEESIFLTDTIALPQSVTINAGTKDISIAGAGTKDAFDETNGTLTLLTGENGRIRLIQNDAQIKIDEDYLVEYDSEWEFRNLGSEQITVDTADDGAENLTDGSITLREAGMYAGKTYREYALGSQNVTLPLAIVVDAALSEQTITLTNGLCWETTDMTVNGNGVTLDSNGNAISVEKAAAISTDNLNFANANIELEANTLLNVNHAAIKGLQTSGDGAITVSNSDVTDNVLNNAKLTFDASTISNGFLNNLKNVDIINNSTLTNTRVDNLGNLTVSESAITDSDLFNNTNVSFEWKNNEQTQEMEEIRHETIGQMNINSSSVANSRISNDGSAGIFRSELSNSNISNSGDLNLLENSFTGEYDLNNNDQGEFALINNYQGKLSITDTDFSGIALKYETFPKTDYDELDAVISASLIANYSGTVMLDNVNFINNSLFVSAEHGDAEANFALAVNFGDGEHMVGVAYLNRAEIYGNKSVAWSTFGFASAQFVGLYNNNADAFVYNSVIYGNKASASNAIEGEQESQSYGVYSNIEDIVLTNDTILDTIGLTRARAIMNNTIYSTTAFERGFIDLRISDNNVCVEGKDVSTLFVSFDSETGLFEKDATGAVDYRIYADAFVMDGETKIPLINSGNNEEAEKIFEFFEDWDVRDEARIHNEIVDIGAVESQAIDLTAELLNLDAQAAPLETPAIIDGEAYSAGLTSIVCTWDQIVEGLTYYLRFKTDAGSDWTEIADITDAGQTGSSDGFSWTIACTEGVFACAIEGMTPDTWYDFQIIGNGDNINYFRYDPENLTWPEESSPLTVEETTRERLFIPNAAGFDRAPRYEESTGEHSINIGWIGDERAVGYYMTFAWTDASGVEHNENRYIFPASSENPNGYIVKDIAGSYVVNYTLHNLEEGTQYAFTFKALSYYDESLYVENEDGTFNTYVLNSDTVSFTASTKTILQTPVIQDDLKGFDTQTDLASVSLNWTKIYKSDSTEVSKYQVIFVKVDANNAEIGTPVTIVVNSADAVNGFQKISSSLTPGARYKFSVRAYEPNSISYVSSPYSAPYFCTMLQQLDAPELSGRPMIVPFGASGYNTNSVDTIYVSWTIPENAENVVLEYSANGTEFTTVETSAGQTSAIVNGLTEGTEYTFRVTASADEEFFVSAVTTAVISTAVHIDAPSVAWKNTDTNNGAAVLYWDCVNNSTGYLANGTFSTSTTYTTPIMGVGGATRFDVYAAVGTDAIDGVYYAWSNRASATIIRAKCPTEVTATAMDSTSVELSWKGNENANALNYYEIQYHKQGENPWTTASGNNLLITGTTAYIRGLESGAEYEFIVRAVTKDSNTAGETTSAFSDGVSATTKTAPETVLRPNALATQTTEIALNWLKPTEEDGYYFVIDVYQGENLIKQVGSAKNIVGTSCNITGLQENTEYMFNIYSYNTNTEKYVGHSAAAVTTATTWAKMDLELGDGSTGYDSVKLQWNNDNDARSDLVNYRIEYGDNFVLVNPGTLEKTITGLTEGESYTFTIYAANANGIVTSTADSVTVTALKHLDTPRVSATPDSVYGTSRILVTWNVVEHASSYRVDCAAGTVSAYTINGSTMSAYISGLDDDTNYDVTVTALGGQSGGVTYTSSSATDDATTWRKLTAPTFTAGSAEGKEISLTWKPLAADVTSGQIANYAVQVYNNGSWNTIYTGTNTSCDYAANAYNTTYSFCVKADSVMGDDGDSAWSNATGNAFTVTTQEKLDVLNFNADAVSTTKIQLTWNELTNAAGQKVANPVYSIQYKAADSSTWKTAAAAITTENGTCSCVIVGLTPDTNYNFSIFASASGYVASDTDYASAKTNAIAPVGTLTATAAVNGQDITVLWNELENAGSYIVKNNTNSTQMSVTTGHSCTFENLEPGKEYSFTVTAIPASEDYSAVSDDCSATTDSIKLTVDLNANSTPNGVVLNWNAVPHATGYTLRYKLEGTSNYTTVDSSAITNQGGVYSTTVTGLNSGMNYVFELVARGDGTQYLDSNPSIKTVCAPAELVLEAFTVENPSEGNSGTRPSNALNLKDGVIDEWTPVYLEVWANADALYDGLQITIPVTVHSEYTIDYHHSNLNLTGLQFTQDNSGNWVIEVTNEFIQNGLDAMVLQLRLIPVSQDNNTSLGENNRGVKVGTPENEWKPVAVVDGVDYTDVKPVPFDLDDNGYVGLENNPSDWDYNLYTKYLTTNTEIIDFNSDDHNCDHDKQMMRTNNGGKSLAAILNAGENWAEYRIDYTVVPCDCTDNDTPQPSPAPAALPTPAAIETVMAEEPESVLMEDFQYDFSIELAKRTADTLPYTRENNRMTSGVILKKTVKTEESNQDEKTMTAKTPDAKVSVDEIWSDSEIDWREIA